MSRHQILSRIARRLPVVWVSPASNWREFAWPSGNFLRGDDWREPRPGLHVFRPGWRHPLMYRPAFMARWTMKSRLEASVRQLRKLGANRIALYLWRAEFAPALDLIAHDFSCYHIDDEYSFEAVERPVPRHERQLIERVDQVIVHSPAMMNKKGGINPRTAMIPNGVDFAAYSTAAPLPADLAGIPRPIIGYAGIIKHQLDLELLLGIARSRPRCSFVLVGPERNLAAKEQFLGELRKLPNVHLLGNRPPESLPAYVQHFDVCLMCYEVNDYTKYIYPLKLHEYLAGGQPVVSSPIDAVVRTSAPVAVASTLEEWLAAIDASLQEEARSAERRAARRAMASSHDWTALADRITGIFEAAPACRA